MRNWLAGWLGVRAVQVKQSEYSDILARLEGRLARLEHAVRELERRESHLDEIRRLADGCMKGLAQCSNDIAAVERRRDA